MHYYSYSRTSNILLDLTFDKLWGPISSWIHSPSNGKSEVMKAYMGLTDKQRSLLAQDVSRAFTKAHGDNTVLAYRYKDRPRHMGGMSLTTEEPKYLARDKYTAFEVSPSDVLAHWAQDGLPLGGKAFGHEKELILKPDANPKRIDP